MDAKFEQILEKAHDVFMRLGIRSVTMDDVAKHLSISKKTLYKYVTDKSDLVQQSLALAYDREQEIINEIISRGLNAIDENLEISKYVVGQLRQVHPSIHYDLEKYYPEAWSEFQGNHHKSIYDCVYQNLEKGIKEGLYRDNLNIPVLTRIYIARFDIVFDGQLFPANEFNFADVYLELFRYHIRGIASERGVKYLVEKIKKEN